MSNSSAPTGHAILRQATAMQNDGASDSERAAQAEALPCESTKVSGQIMPCRGDACPQSFPVPPCARKLGDAIENNKARGTASCLAGCE